MEGSKYFAKVKTPSAKKGIYESGGFEWGDPEKDALYHSDWGALEKYVYKELTELSDYEKENFIMKVQNDPNWEYEDLEAAWYNEEYDLKKTAEHNPKLLRHEAFRKRLAEYEGGYPGDEVYRELMRHRGKATMEDKLINEFSEELSIY